MGLQLFGNDLSPFFGNIVKIVCCHVGSQRPVSSMLLYSSNKEFIRSKFPCLNISATSPSASAHFLFFSCRITRCSSNIVNLGMSKRHLWYTEFNNDWRYSVPKPAFEWKMSSKNFANDSGDGSVSRAWLLERTGSLFNASKRPKSWNSFKIISVFKFCFWRTCFRNIFLINLDNEALPALQWTARLLNKSDWSSWSVRSVSHILLALSSPDLLSEAATAFNMRSSKSCNVRTCLSSICSFSASWYPCGTPFLLNAGFQPRRFFFWQFCSTAVAGGQSWQPHCDDQILGQSHMKPENPKVANPRNKVQNQCVVSHPCNCRMSNRPLHLQDEVWTHHTSHSKVHRGGHFPAVY